MRSTTWFFGVMFVALMLLLGGCSERENIQQRAENPALMATWESECAGWNDWNPVNLSYKVYRRYSGEKYVEVHRFFDTKNCTDPAVEVRFDGKFTVGADVTPNVKQIDVTVDKAEARAITESGKKSLETIKFCGVNEWAVNTAVPLTTRKCALVRAIPSTEYNVFTVDSDKLFLGATGIRGGETKPENRPPQVDAKKPNLKSNEKIDL